MPGILRRTRVYLELTLRPPGHFVDFLNFASDFAPDQLSDSALRENSEFPEWSTKHPLFSLEISGNAKCWGPSVFLFVCRKKLVQPKEESGQHGYKEGYPENPQLRKRSVAQEVRYCGGV